MRFTVAGVPGSRMSRFSDPLHPELCTERSKANATTRERGVEGGMSKTLAFSVEMGEIGPSYIVPVGRVKLKEEVEMGHDKKRHDRQKQFNACRISYKPASS